MGRRQHPSGEIEHLYLWQKQKNRKMIDWRNHIESDSDILRGKPIVKGTRLSVEFLVERLADGWTEAEIMESYPNITKDSINAIYAYVYEVLKDSMIYSIDRKVA